MRHEKAKRKNIPRIHKRRPPGAVPGIGKQETAASEFELITYNKHQIHEETFTSIEKLEKFIVPEKVSWIEVHDLQNERLIGDLGEFFGLHHLSLEDVVHSHQRSKIEKYGDILYIVLRIPVHDLETEQLSLFVGDNFVLTFLEKKSSYLKPIKDRLLSGGRIRGSNAGYLAYAIIDIVIDHFFPILEHFADRLDSMEEALVEHPESIPTNRIHEVRSELLLLRRVIWAHREMVYTLVRESHKQFDDDTVVFLRDCYDHTLQQLDLVETYRDIGGSLMDLSFSAASKQSADIMRVLTIVASIFIPLTFIAGIYGMNFNTTKSPWNMPELEWYFGYPMALSMMLAVAGGLLIYFKVKKWI